MDRATALKILEIQDKYWETEEHAEVLKRHKVLNARFLREMETMTKEQRDAVLDYLGLLIEVHFSVLEIVLTQQ